MSYITPDRSDRFGSSPSTDTGPLELRHQRGTPQYFLCGRQVPDGAAIELSLPNGQWLAGTYEWDGHESRWPNLRFRIGGPWERDKAPDQQPSMLARLAPGGLMRWSRGS